jgi:hypothetical protein
VRVASNIQPEERVNLDLVYDHNRARYGKFRPMWKKYHQYGKRMTLIEFLALFHHGQLIKRFHHLHWTAIDH